MVGVFGVPTVNEDDAGRAVRAGLRMIKTIADFDRPDGSPLQARVGINTGEAVVRLTVAPGSGEGFLTGDAVNTAARLEAAAPPMGVVVGGLTHKLTGDACLYEALPPLSAERQVGRVAAWLAREPRDETGRPRPTNAAAMVGRERELAACTAATSRLREGQGGLLLLTGEAGIGKSRLVAELRAGAEEHCAWLEGHTLSFGRSISYWPFLEIIQEDAGIGSDDPEAARWAKLADRVTELFDGRPRRYCPTWPPS